MGNYNVFFFILFLYTIISLGDESGETILYTLNLIMGLSIVASGSIIIIIGKDL